MKIIVPQRIAPKADPAILQIDPNCQIVHIDEEGNSDGDLSDADVFLRWWTGPEAFRRVLSQANNIRWVHTPSAGVEHLLRAPELRNSSILLTNSVGAHAIPIAEFVMMYMLNHIKKARAMYELHPETAWQFEDREELDELAGKTLLIIGLGSIGQEIANRAQAFGMRVIGSRRTPTVMINVDRVVGADGWRELLPEADYVVVATPLTAETRNLIGAAELATMKPTAYLMNIARGAVINTEALVAALNQGTIAGAAVDVTEPEPPPADHPLWKARNIWITPHISYSSPRTPERMLQIFLDNLVRYRKGEALVNVVDKQAGY
jgi:phosphoglycerate dehydrogenase-like enzyme